MKKQLHDLVLTALEALQKKGALGIDAFPAVHIEQTRDPTHGDFACNIAMLLGKAAKCAPRALAEKIVAALPVCAAVTKVEIAGPGFINFFLAADAQLSVVQNILQLGKDFGRSHLGQGKKIHIEYVSANPTGPLHVGHGRHPAYGASVANLLEAIGYQVHREYYINDAGRQMDILAVSVWVRYLQSCGIALQFPNNAYKGEYINDIASQIKQKFGTALVRTQQQVVTHVPDDSIENQEAHIDALIDNAKKLLGADYQAMFKIALDSILDDIRDDLLEYGVKYDEWFSEKKLIDSGAVKHAIEVLESKGFIDKKEGATWFKSTEFGDDKDRVLVRANGQTTYFASDIAYHLNKLERGFDHIVDVLGSDHHGYIPRIRAVMSALTGNSDTLTVSLIQFVTLYRGEEKVAMSTRAGEFITLRELRKEIGNDAARFFYVMRKADQHMDFDLELAKSKSNENPVFYIQYAHARICSVLRQLIEKGFEWQCKQGLEHVGSLVEPAEQQLIKKLSQYPEVLENAARHYEPHLLAYYLRELANDLHAYYNGHQFLVEDANLRAARLNLICAVKQVLANGLSLLGVNAPGSM
ncbi:MAG: arginine--tRNA ligase [Gammaproteobacteria bacterium]|nr:arginine--tRNA ligase [Gammaproteobacteria bacterium]